MEGTIAYNPKIEWPISWKLSIIQQSNSDWIQLCQIQYMSSRKPSTKLKFPGHANVHKNKIQNWTTKATLICEILYLKRKKIWWNALFINYLIISVNWIVGIFSSSSFFNKSSQSQLPINCIHKILQHTACARVTSSKDPLPLKAAKGYIYII